MRIAEIRELLCGVESWEKASQEAVDEFDDAMKDKQYGFGPIRNAWGWFYDGWCRSQDHQSVILHSKTTSEGF